MRGGAAGKIPFAERLNEHLLEEPSPLERKIWAAAQVLGWSPFDPRLLDLNVFQLDWALLMRSEDTRKQYLDQIYVERDQKALELINWCCSHLTG
jgi:hypothetical protein